MDKSEAWQKWWSVVRGAAPVGTYNPQEDNMHKAWMAAWDAAQAHADKEITHLKEQLMRANTNDGAYKAAFLAGQMAKKK